jgi:hypothetical protein
MAGAPCVVYLVRMPLDEIAPGLWSHVHVLRFPGNVRMPVRMNVARLASGELWVHSPVPTDDALAAEIGALGRVRHVVSPSKYHHAFAGRFVARFPEAALHGAPGVAQKHPELMFGGTLGEGASPWSAEIDQVLLDGAPGLNEFVFFHRASRSLMVTDLFFNITEPESWGTALITRMAGTYRRFGVSRLWHIYRKDRALMKASLEKVLAWDFVRVLPAHGVVFAADDAPAEARRRLAWMLA